MQKNIFVLIILFMGFANLLTAQMDLEKAKALCAKSKTAWIEARDACGNNYSYMMKEAFMPSERYHVLLVEVVEGKVAKTILKKYDANKLIETSDKLVTTFHNNPVGTIDDIYKYAEERVFKLDMKVYQIDFETDKNNIVSYLGWKNPEMIIPDRATPSYSIYNLGLGKMPDLPKQKKAKKNRKNK